MLIRIGPSFRSWQANLSETSAVTGTNRIDFSVHADPRTNRYVICSAEDNLIKGAGGQAIQAMNLCQGYPEEAGLS